MLFRGKPAFLTLLGVCEIWRVNCNVAMATSCYTTTEVFWWKKYSRYSCFVHCPDLASIFKLTKDAARPLHNCTSSSGPSAVSALWSLSLDCHGDSRSRRREDTNEIHNDKWEHNKTHFFFNDHLETNARKCNNVYSSLSVVSEVLLENSSLQCSHLLRSVLSVYLNGPGGPYMPRARSTWVWDFVPVWRVELIFSLDDLLVELCVVLVVKWRVSTESVNHKLRRGRGRQNYTDAPTDGRQTGRYIDPVHVQPSSPERMKECVNVTYRIKEMTPTAQRSTSLPYVFCCRSSGAVTTDVKSSWWTAHIYIHTYLPTTGAFVKRWRCYYNVQRYTTLLGP